MVVVSSDSGFALGPRAGDARALSLQLLVILGRTTGMGSLGNNGGIVGMALGDVDFFLCWLPYLHGRFSRDF